MTSVAMTPVCLPPPLSQLSKLNAHVEKQAKESELKKQAKQMAITMAAMYNAKPECDLRKRKRDELQAEWSQKAEKKRKLESSLGALLQQYRSMREEYLKAKADMREAFQRMNDLEDEDDFPDI